jgi:Holliday junction DNA resolvase RuvB-like protein
MRPLAQIFIVVFCLSGGEMKRPWFEVLNVSQDACLEDAKTAMRRLIFAYHSDRLRSIEGLHPDFYKFADEHLKEINQAFEEAKATCKPRSASRGQGHHKRKSEEPLRSSFLADLIVGNDEKRDFEHSLNDARENSKPLGHLLIIGRSGLPLSAIARTIAVDVGVNYRDASTTDLTSIRELAILLANLEERDISAIDCMQRLAPDDEDVLVSAMRNFNMTLIIGEDKEEHSVTVELAHFTLVGLIPTERHTSPRLLDAFNLHVHVR